jgi:hypothetical protein
MPLAMGVRSKANQSRTENGPYFKRSLLKLLRQYMAEERKLWEWKKRTRYKGRGKKK